VKIFLQPVDEKHSLLFPINTKTTVTVCD